jgi:hypothetical protein
MCAEGLASNGSSIALARTLAVGLSGQPPPKRFDPQERQKVFALPSAGSNVWSKSSPSRIRIAPTGTRPFTVPVPPESFLQLSQWQYLSVSGASVSSNFTPPQRQLPRRAVTPGSLLPRLAAISTRGVITWLVVVVLLAAAAYEAAIALEWISLGSEPGNDAPGQAVVTNSAFLALAVGIGLGVAGALRRGHAPRWPGLLIPIAAAAYLVGHYYAFDSYYLPTLRRFSDDGNIAARWVYGVAGCAVCVAGVIALAPRVGMALLPLMLLFVGVFVVGEGIGH